MTATTRTKTRTRTNHQATAGVATSVAAGAGLGVMTGAAALVSLWTIACFASAVLSNGPVTMLRGWFGAITG